MIRQTTSSDLAAGVVQHRCWIALLAVLCLLGQATHASFHLVAEAHVAGHHEGADPLDAQAGWEDPADSHEPHSEIDHRLHPVSQRSEGTALLIPPAALTAALPSLELETSGQCLSEPLQKASPRRAATPCQPRSPPRA
jgi:hypothetical protein